MSRVVTFGVFWLAMATALPNEIVAQSGVSATIEQVAAKKDAELTARQQKWQAATEQERVRFAEAIGEKGAREMAKIKGYKVLYDGLDTLLPQGPDQVYRATDGRVIVYEEKGGSGQLGHAFGHPQGSTEWAVESAKRVLRSTKAGGVERAAAREILAAAAKGRLEVHVIRTKHVLGEPTVAVLEGLTKTTHDAMRLARGALDDLMRVGVGGAANALRVTKAVDGALSTADDIARASAVGGSIVKTVSKAAVPLAVAVDSGFRVQKSLEAERQFTAGKLSVQEREVIHVTNAAGMVGGWGGAWAGAKIGATGGGLAGSAITPGAGTAVGCVLGGVAGSVAGYYGGEAAAEAGAQWTVKRVHAAGTTIVDSAKVAWKATTRAASSTAKKVNRGWNWLWGR